jgi:pilus assembly protein Flp/PilA
MLAFLVAAQTFVADRFDKKNDRGATAVEYGLLVALIAGVIIAAVLILGPLINGAFDSVNDGLTGAGVTVAD